MTRVNVIISEGNRKKKRVNYFDIRQNIGIHKDRREFPGFSQSIIYI